MTRTIWTPITRRALRFLIVALTGSMLQGCRRTPRNEGAQAPPADSGFAAMQARGEGVMGVNQYESAHVFEDLPDGGRIVLERDDPSDAIAITAIRQHMRDIAGAFQRGDFAKPFHVHAQTVPGTRAMSAGHAAITYEERDRPRGAEVRIRAADPLTVASVHEFLAFQRGAHHAAGHEGTME